MVLSGFVTVSVTPEKPFRAKTLVAVNLCDFEMSRLDTKTARL